MKISDAIVLDKSYLEGKIQYFKSYYTAPEHIPIRRMFEELLEQSKPLLPFAEKIFSEIDTDIALNDDNICRNDYPAKLVRNIIESTKEQFLTSSI